MTEANPPPGVIFFSSVPPLAICNEDGTDPVFSYLSTTLLFPCPTPPCRRRLGRSALSLLSTICPFRHCALPILSSEGVSLSYHVSPLLRPPCSDPSIAICPQRPIC